jgi:sulfur carrier protein ThiS
MGINGLKDNIPMTTIEIQIKEKNEILKGLEKTYETLLAFKKSKNSELVVLRNNKIVKLKPYKSTTL